MAAILFSTQDSRIQHEFRPVHPTYRDSNATASEENTLRSSCRSGCHYWGSYCFIMMRTPGMVAANNKSTYRERRVGLSEEARHHDCWNVVAFWAPCVWARYLRYTNKWTVHGSHRGNTFRSRVQCLVPAMIREGRTIENPYTFTLRLLSSQSLHVYHFSSSLIHTNSDTGGLSDVLPFAKPWSIMSKN